MSFSGGRKLNVQFQIQVFAFCAWANACLYAGVVALFGYSKLVDKRVSLGI